MNTKKRNTRLASSIFALVFSLTIACDSDEQLTDEQLTDGGPKGNDDKRSCPNPELPPVVMKSRSGTQTGVHGSYCVGSESLGCYVCADRGVVPNALTVVRDGDTLAFSMSDGKLVAGERCNPACPPTLRIEKLVCEGKRPATETVVIEEDQPWTVDLEPGQYTIWLDTHFEAAGLSGGVYVGFGLVVDPMLERVVRLSGSEAFVCEEADAG